MPVALSGEGLDVGDGFSKDERVDVLRRGFVRLEGRRCTQQAHVCSFVRIRNLQIGDVPADVILIRSSVPTEDIQQYPRMLQRLPAIISLHETDHLWRGQPSILQPPHLQARLEAQRNLRVRVGQLLLNQLEGSERARELLTL